MLEFILGIVPNLGTWAAGALAVIVGVFLHGRKKKNEGKKEAIQEMERQIQTARDEARETRDEIDDEIFDLPAGGAADRLHDDWSRD